MNEKKKTEEFQLFVILSAQNIIDIMALDLVIGMLKTKPSPCVKDKLIGSQKALTDFLTLHKLFSFSSTKGGMAAKTFANRSGVILGILLNTLINKKIGIAYFPCFFF